MFNKTTRSGHMRCCKCTKCRCIKQGFVEWHKGNGLTWKGRQTLCLYFMLLSFHKTKLWISKGYMVWSRADMWVLWDQRRWWRDLGKAFTVRTPHFHLIKSFLCLLKYPNERNWCIEFKVKGNAGAEGKLPTFCNLTHNQRNHEL